jgi:two-component system chemotaxis sensor kinase CheA
MGQVASTSPPADKLETIESLTRFEVHFTTDQSAKAIRQAVDLDGVQAIELQGAEAEDVDAPPPPEPSLPAATEKTPLPAAEPTAAGPPAGPDRSRPMGVETMRVEIDRLDSLMNLAGELVVNRARFVQIAGQVAPAFRKRNVVSRSRDFGESLRRTLEHLQSMSSTNGELARDIDELTAGLALMEEQTALWDSGCRGFAQISEAIDQLTRISDSLQQEVLDTRMVPVGPLFNRFKRVFRDLS